MSDADKIRPLLRRVLDTISRQFNVAREMMPFEVEEVVRRALFEALKVGRQGERRKSTQQFHAVDPDKYKRDEEDE